MEKRRRRVGDKASGAAAGFWMGLAGEQRGISADFGCRIIGRERWREIQGKWGIGGILRVLGFAEVWGLWDSVDSVIQQIITGYLWVSSGVN